jgi:hypothetical protein
MKPGFYLLILKQKSSQINVVCQKADGNCFLGHKRNTDGGIHSAIP